MADRLPECRQPGLYFLVNPYYAEVHVRKDCLRSAVLRKAAEEV